MGWNLLIWLKTFQLADCLFLGMDEIWERVKMNRMKKQMMMMVELSLNGLWMAKCLSLLNVAEDEGSRVFLILFSFLTVFRFLAAACWALVGGAVLGCA